MARPGDRDSGIRIRTPQGTALALLAALAANTLLFYALALARMKPALSSRSRPDPVELKVMTLRPPEPQTFEIEAPAIDILPLDFQRPLLNTTQTIPEAETAIAPRLPDGVRAIGPDLPGLTVALPGPADLRSVPSSPVDVIESPLSLSGVDRPPRKISGAPPRVPAWARRGRLEGKVTVRFVVTAEGQVTDLNVRRIEGDERFGREAMRALATWRFEPATRRGRPVACWCAKTISFELSY